jgi:hypothetical protein
MKLAKIKAVKEWIAAWKALAANGWYVGANAALDIIFFVLYGFVTAPLFAKLTEHVIAIGTIAAEQMRSVAGRARPAVIDVLFQQPVSRYTWQFIALIVLLSIVVYVLYCIFQGIAWYLAGRITGSRVYWRNYLLHFARINLLWGGLYLIWQCLSTVFDLRRIAIEKLMNQIAPTSGYFFSVLLGLIIYFAIVSYPILSIRKAFASGLRKIPVLIPAALVIGVQFFAGNFIAKWITGINAKFGFILSVMLLLVLFAWTRAYVTFVVRRSADGV